MKRLLAAALLAAAQGAVPHAALGDDSAVVLMYHRFGEDQFPSTNIRIVQFEDHIRELQSEGYNVVPLADVVAAVKSGRSLPDKAVAITVDDGYASVYDEAWPRLKAAGFPFTVFIATDPIDRGLSGFMSWDQVRELRDAGVAIGAHSHTHPHLPEAGAENARRELAQSNARFETELGKVPPLFAYPFGEVSKSLADMVKEFGYEAAFGQQSGAIHASSDRYYLPRFALNEQYGEMGRFRLVARSLPIPVADLTPEDPFVTDPNPPLIGFTVDATAGPLGRLACFASTEGRIEVQRLGARRIELRLARALPPGRARINCTLPTTDGRWRWLGLQFTVPGGRG